MSRYTADAALDKRAGDQSADSLITVGNGLCDSDKSTDDQYLIAPFF